MKIFQRFGPNFFAFFCKAKKDAKKKWVKKNEKKQNTKERQKRILNS